MIVTRSVWGKAPHKLKTSTADMLFPFFYIAESILPAPSVLDNVIKASKELSIDSSEYIDVCELEFYSGSFH
jgi:hypothetical protein